MPSNLTQAGWKQRIQDLRADIDCITHQEFALRCRLAELGSQKETLELSLKAAVGYAVPQLDPEPGPAVRVQI